MVYLGGSLILVIPANRKPLDDLIVQKVRLVKDIDRYPYLSDVISGSVFENLWNYYRIALIREKEDQRESDKLGQDILAVEKLIAEFKDKIASLEDKRSL